MTTTASAPACPRCGGTDTQIREQVFKDGTVHLRETCCRCDAFIRYAPRHQAEAVRQVAPVASRQPLPLRQTAPAVNTTLLPPEQETFTRAQQALAEVAERAAALQQTTPADGAESLALFGVAVAAGATLSQENIASLTAAARQGKLPRRTTR